MVEEGVTLSEKKGFRKGVIFPLIFLSVGLIYVIYHIYFYNAPRQSHYSHVSSINLEQESLGGIKLLQSIELISPTPTPNNDIDIGSYQYYTLDDRKTVATMRGDDLIILISVYSDHSVSTAKGIGFDSTEEDVLDAYGTSYYKRGEQGAEIIGYVDKINHQNLEFWLHNHRVNMIRYSDSRTLF